jgi:hypothetical protein
MTFKNIVATTLRNVANTLVTIADRIEPVVVAAAETVTAAAAKVGTRASRKADMDKATNSEAPSENDVVGVHAPNAVALTACAYAFVEAFVIAMVVCTFLSPIPAILILVGWTIFDWNSSKVRAARFGYWVVRNYLRITA